MPFAMEVLKKSILSFTTAAVTVIGAQVGKVVWDKGLKHFTEKAAEDIFHKEEESPI